MSLKYNNYENWKCTISYTIQSNKSMQTHLDCRLDEGKCKTQANHAISMLKHSYKYAVAILCVVYHCMCMIRWLTGWAVDIDRDCFFER